MNKILLLSSLFITLLGLMFSCNQAPKNVLPANNQIGNLCDLAYGSHPRQVLDITLPANRDTATGTLVLIHGGAWAAGDKKDMEVLRGLLSVQTGLAVAAINYRYATPDSIDYTHLMEDVDLALDYIENEAGLWEIGTGKFGLAGVSAGGHMSLLYGYAYDSDDRVQAVSSMAGPTDLTDSLFHVSATLFGLYDELEDLVDELFAQNPQAFVPPSPIFNLKNIPTQLIHGESDLLVPKEQSINLAAALDSQLIQNELILYPNIGHNIFGPLLSNTANVTQDLRDWFSVHLN
jgi:acetyl esterase/lipase